MVDVAEKAGLRLDPAKLSEELGIPVVPMQANAKKGIVELKQALRFPFPAAPEATWIADRDAIRKPAAAPSSRGFANSPPAARTRTSRRYPTRSTPCCSIRSAAGSRFIVILFTVFWAIFSFAANPDGLDRVRPGRARRLGRIA